MPHTCSIGTGVMSHFSYFPVCGRLRVVTEFIKQCVNRVTKEWDGVACNATLKCMIHKTAKENWCVTSKEMGVQVLWLQE